MAPKDFNYQVALKEGLKSLEQGRLRQAEQSFKYLVDKFPGSEGGYRGLAKVYFEQDDRPSALRVLRDGATALTKSGERSAAIGLLRQAVSLDPRDFATHRRLAAALALAGDSDASVQEYARFIGDLRDTGQSERAKSEAAYARGQLRGVKGLSSLDAIASGESAVADDRVEAGARVADEPAERTPRLSEREAGTAVRLPREDPWAMRRVEPAPSSTLPPEPSVSTPADDPWSAPPPTTYPGSTRSPQPLHEVTLENDPWSTIAPGSTVSWTPRDGPTEEEPPSPQAGEDWSAAPDSANGEPTIEADPAAVEAAAARYLATRDPRAAHLALEAARHYLKEGHTDAASDLLLQLIAAGVADHDAQRLLVDVARMLGKREVAKTKCRLLVQALLLDGRNDLAAEVEALALAE